MNRKPMTFRDALDAIEEHSLLFAWLLIVFVVLCVIGGIVASRVSTDMMMSVCFAKHSPAECDPNLRVKTAEEVTRLNEMYLRCLNDHAGGQMLCREIYEH